MTPTGMAPRFQIGAVLRTSFGLIGRHVWALAAVGLVDAIAADVPSDIATARGFGTWSSLAIGVVPSLVVGSWSTAATAHLCLGDLEGQRGRLSRSVAVTGRRLLPIMGISFLVGVGVVAGLALFVVPGVLLALRYSVSIQAAIGEGLSIRGATDRSAQLTQGHRWAILAVQLLIGPVGVPSIVLTTLLGHFSEILPAFTQAALFAPAVTIVLNAVTDMIGDVGFAAIYAELRRLEGRPVGEPLAAVFS